MRLRLFILFLPLMVAMTGRAEQADTIRVCRAEVPYLYIDPNDADNQHSFETQLESWTDKYGRTYTLAISEPVAIELQENNLELTLPTDSVVIPYSVLIGEPDIYRISYDSAWTAQTGKKDTVGRLEGGQIVVKSLPHSLADREYRWTIEVYNDSNVTAGFACSIPQYEVTLTARNEGMIGVKFDKLLFVPNGDNRWMGYDWYKDGKATGKGGQYYHEEGKVLKGEFEVQATDTAGQVYRSTVLKMEGTETEEKAPARGIEVLRVGEYILYK